MRRTLLHLALLAAVVTAVQAWSIEHSATTALDAVRFVDLAAKMAEQGWLPTIRAEVEYPLFPTLVFLTHHTLHRFFGDYAGIWGQSVTWSAVVPLMLSIGPVYFFLRRLVGARGALAGGLLFCGLSRIASLGADGLSDSTHFLMAVTAMWAIVEYLRRIEIDAADSRLAWVWMLWAGVSIGLAAMARVEAPVLLLCLGLTCAVTQIARGSRLPWRKWGQGAAAVALGLCLTLGPYLILAGATTPQAALARLVCRGDQRPAVAGPVLDGRALPDGLVMSFGPFERTFSNFATGGAPAVRRYAAQLARSLQPAAGLLAIVGTALLWRREAQLPRRFALAVFCTVSVVAVVYGSRVGYLEARHLLLAVTAALAPAGLSAVWLGGRLQAKRKFHFPLPSWERVAAQPPGEGAVCHRTNSEYSRECTRLQAGSFPFPLRWSITAAALACCLIVTLRPLHASRRPHRQAAEWLREHGQPAALVLDTVGLTRLYSGLPTRDYYSAERTLVEPELAFVVLERREMLIETPRGRTLRRLLETSGDAAACFAAPAHKPELDMLVYRWRPERFARLINPWQSAER